MGSAELTWSECLSWECVTEFIGQHYFGIVMVLLCLAKIYGGNRGSKMVEIEGSKVKQVGSMNDWNDYLRGAEGKLVVVDFYATWCGPCVRAAPVFAQLSIDMEKQPVEFWKVDVDKAAAVSRREGISCMPTFKFYRVGEKGSMQSLETVQGWSESKVRGLVDKFTPK